MPIAADEPTVGIALPEYDAAVVEQLIEDALQAPDLEIDRAQPRMVVIQADPNWGRVWGRTFSGVEAY